MTGYISLSFWDSLCSLVSKNLKLSKMQTMPFYTSSPRKMFIYSTDIDKNEEKNWKLEITKSLQEKSSSYDIEY